MATIKEKISFIVPCFNEEESIPMYFTEMETLKSTMGVDFEYVFINDGSKDNTLHIIRNLAIENPNSIKYISFSRNFGKESAIYAGLEKSTGDYVTVMDVDLQHPPHLLPKMYQLIKRENYDSVFAKRRNRDGESTVRSFFSRLFYKIMKGISDTELVSGATDYRLMTRQMVNAVLEVTEYNRFSKGIFGWVGFDNTYIEYDNVERELGETKWSFIGLLSYSISGIVSFSEVPLKLATILGFLTFLFSVSLGLFIAVKTLVFDNPTDGWTTLVVLITGLGGVQLLSIGAIGEYLGRTYLETKRRPLYISKETEQDLHKNKEDL